jgi:uncharacterized protein YbjT (DUF2867 family)
MKLKVIITGVTGMVGEGVLHECIHHPSVESILIVGRRASGITNPKVKELLVKDFFSLDEIKPDLQGYNACFFCLGVSAVGMKEADYERMTYQLTMHFATLLSTLNQGMTFSYISGSGTDSSEKGRQMWARVKGKTENHLAALPFKAVYLFRPGYMQPTAGLKNSLKYYRYIGWMYPALRFLFPGFVTTLKELGLAMIEASFAGYDRKIIEVKDIVKLAARSDLK